MGEALHYLLLPDALISSLLYGHAGITVDYPSREAAPSLQAERLAGMRPYFRSTPNK